MPLHCQVRAVRDDAPWYNARGFPGPSVDVSVRIGSVQSRESSVINLSTPLQMTTHDCDPSLANESTFNSTPYRLHCSVTNTSRADPILVSLPSETVG